MMWARHLLRIILMRLVKMLVKFIDKTTNNHLIGLKFNRNNETPYIVSKMFEAVPDAQTVYYYGDNYQMIVETQLKEVQK